MAERSGFFNAVQTEGVYDRKYNANDYSENMSVVISNGVLRSTGDDLKVTANGLILTIATGRAWITGHWYHNSAAKVLSPVIAPTGGSRIDRVVLRLDKSLSERQVHIVYLQGTAANIPIEPVITRTDTIYDLVLADIRIEANSSTVTITDQRSNANLCGWVYSTSGDNSFFTSLDNSFHEWFQNVRDELSSVTLFKRYNWRTVLAVATNQVSFNIPQYDANTCFIEVFVNGILETLTSDYTISNTILTFSGTLVSGTEIEVKAYKSIDGTGIQTISGEITELQNAVAALNGVANFTYKCTGLNDNISLSQIAKAFYDGSYIVGSLQTAAEAFLNAIGGNTYLAALPNEFQATINVYGVLGVTSPYSGSGTSSSRYRWFSFGTSEQTAKRIIFDFAKVPTINILGQANSENIIFYGTDIFIKNATVNAGSTNANCAITMFVGSNRLNSQIENCRLAVRTTGKAVIATHGNFANCDMHCKSSGADAFCIDAEATSLVRISGGTFFSYVASSMLSSSVINVPITASTAVVFAEDINCPVIAQSGYIQQKFASCAAGTTIINRIITTLASSGSASFLTVTNKINMNKQ